MPISIPISELFSDPELRAAFARIEREQGGALVVVINDPELSGGATAEREDA